MKKIYFFILVVLTVNASATNWTIDVKTIGFVPSSLNVVVGDVVTFHLVSGSHTTTSFSVPSGAATWDNTMTSTDFSYTVTHAGTYAYYCKTHVGGSEAGSFNATPIGIIEPKADWITSAFPIPFNDKITIKYKEIDAIEVINIIGEKVKKLELSPAQNKTEIDFSGQPAGVYFYRTYKEGTLVETRKVIKAN